MQRLAALATALFVLSGVPVFAAVKVVQGVAIGNVLFTVTSQREVHALTAPGRPARLMGRLPRHTSPLVSDGMAAWAVTVGRRAAPSVRLFQVHPAAQAVLEFRLEPPSIPGRVEVEGVAGADTRYVYLMPDLHIDLQKRLVERGHLVPFPDLEVLRALRAGDDTCYLARDRSGAEGMTARLWLLRSPDRDAATRADTAGWLKVEAGAAAGPVDLKADESNLFVVFEQGRILRFDRRALRLAEDLSPMLHPGRIRFFAADAQSYWVGQDGARAVEENETEPEAMTLWQIDRQALDGGTFHAGAVPAGFEPLATGQGRIWFGSREHRRHVPLIAVSEADGTARSYPIRAMHARRWAAAGQGLEAAGEVAIYGGALTVVLGIVTLPIWIWFV